MARPRIVLGALIVRPSAPLPAFAPFSPTIGAGSWGLKPGWVVASIVTGSVMAGAGELGVIVSPGFTGARPFWLAFCSVNQRLPSGPAVIWAGLLVGVGTLNSPVTTPAVVIRPTWLASCSVN